MGLSTNDMRVKIHYVPIHVVKDPMVSIGRCVGEHELPILKEIHGDGAIELIAGDETITKSGKGKNAAHERRVGDIIMRDDEIVNALEEYERLVRKYGRHVEREMSNAEAVYGRFDTGTFVSSLGGPVDREEKAA